MSELYRTKNGWTQCGIHAFSNGEVAKPRSRCPHCKKADRYTLDSGPGKRPFHHELGRKSSRHSHDKEGPDRLGRFKRTSHKTTGRTKTARQVRKLEPKPKRDRKLEKLKRKPTQVAGQKARAKEVRGG